ncbi:MAG: peptide-methionine (S)-S-oxide reductase MsrA [Patescibacteria group bacterium]
MEIAVFGGGCFWCTEATFKMLKGVSAVTPGYTGGTTDNPTYDAVSSGRSGHAEVIRIEFDPEKIAFTDLLTVFFATHDPTTPNRQGADVGTQYRSAVFFTTPAQKKETEAFIADLQKEGVAVVTEVASLGIFTEAEEYHKDYFAKNATAGYCQIVIAPKVEKVQKRFAQLLKEGSV